MAFTVMTQVSCSLCSKWLLFGRRPIGYTVEVEHSTVAIFNNLSFVEATLDFVNVALKLNDVTNPATAVADTLSEHATHFCSSESRSEARSY